MFPISDKEQTSYYVASANRFADKRKEEIQEIFFASA
jgi:hypothetical protein